VRDAPADGPSPAPDALRPEIDLPDGLHYGAADDAPAPAAVGGRLRLRLLHTAVVTLAGRCVVEDYVHAGRLPRDATDHLLADRCLPPPLRVLLALIVASDAHSERDTRAFRRNLSRLYRSAPTWNHGLEVLRGNDPIGQQKDGSEAAAAPLSPHA
jgi:hypothetical protein